MTPRPLSLAERLRGRLEPVGYVSFLSALVHHGALVDSLAAVQVASPQLAGRERDFGPGPADFYMVPRDLFFGYRLEPFEGEVVPVASPEKALLDWAWLAEEHGLDPRLSELEWEVFDLAELLKEGAAGAGASAFPEDDRTRAARRETWGR